MMSRRSAPTKAMHHQLNVRLGDIELAALDAEVDRLESKTPGVRLYRGDVVRMLLRKLCQEQESRTPAKKKAA